MESHIVQLHPPSQTRVRVAGHRAVVARLVGDLEVPDFSPGGVEAQGSLTGCAGECSGCRGMR